MTTSPQIHFSILTNLASLNTTPGTPQKLCLPLFTINWYLPSAIRKYHASVFSTSPPHSTLYTTPLSHLIESSSVDHHLYADDTQLFISFSPASFSTSIAHLLSVVNQI